MAAASRERIISTDWGVWGQVPTAAAATIAAAIRVKSGSPEAMAILRTNEEGESECPGRD